METIHPFNIATHVIAGSLALLTGIGALAVPKGSIQHIRLGRYFIWFVAVVITTGLLGVFVFKRNNFLLVITLLSGYNCFSGIRAIRQRGRKPDIPDSLASAVVILSAVYYLYYLHASGLYWSPVITYSTIGALLLVTAYDLLKWILPASIRKKAGIYEHVYKMISALSGLTAAFSGTVLPQYKPYSQLLPVVIGFSYIIIIFITIGRYAPSKTN
ncbi:hypothetical protein ACDQ55_16265 [Chitinophaga sp. 30R24]|uniref:hypothetical protein n=1 Tax=Chitinophaga sp. 30R24 TaxID=3248838 RepID=UPI003B91BCE0